MDWSSKYKQITSGFYKCAEDVSNEYPDCGDFEKCVIALRLNGWTYGNIQKKLGMPPKKLISAVLNKWAPQLVDNAKSKEVKVSMTEAELYNIVKSKPNQELKVSIEDEDYIFYIANKKLFFEDWSASDNPFSSLDDITKQQFLIAIKEQVNE